MKTEALRRFAIFETSLIHEISGPNRLRITKARENEFENDVLPVIVSFAEEIPEIFRKGIRVASRCDKGNLLEMMSDGFAKTC